MRKWIGYFRALLCPWGRLPAWGGFVQAGPFFKTTDAVQISHNFQFARCLLERCVSSWALDWGSWEAPDPWSQVPFRVATEPVLICLGDVPQKVTFFVVFNSHINSNSISYCWLILNQKCSVTCTSLRKRPHISTFYSLNTLFKGNIHQLTCLHGGIMGNTKYRHVC